MQHVPYKMIVFTPFMREDIVTGLSYEELVAAFERELGRWDYELETTLVEEQAPWSKVEQAFARMAGPHGLMIFFHVDQGRLTSLHQGVKKCVLYIVGNGVVAEPILTIDIRASLYVPFRVCLYDNGNPGGAIIGYERPSSVLAVFNNPALYPYGRLLDERMERVVRSIVNRCH